MFSYFKTLMAHGIFALTFTALLVLFSYLLLCEIDDKSKRQDELFITQIIKNTSDDITLKHKIQLLIDSQLFSFIKITNSKNKLIDIYNDEDTFNIAFRSHIHTLYIDDIKIEYHHNESAIARVLYQLLVNTFFCSWGVFFLAALWHQSHLKQYSKNKHTHTYHNKNNNIESTSIPNPPSKNDTQPERDPLTALKNRNAFVEFYTQHIDAQATEQFHLLAISRCSELKTINQTHGFHEGDNYVAHVANLMKAAVEGLGSGELFRLNSSDFACLIPHITKEKAHELASELTKNFNRYQASSKIDSVAYTGIVLFSEPTPLGELLALSDTGISVAQTQSSNACYFHEESDLNSSTSVDQRNWRQEIDNVLENQRINLLIQPIKPIDQKIGIYNEVLARFLNTHNELLPTASFIAMAEKLDKIVALDRLIIEKVMGDIKQHQGQQQCFGINISHRTLNDEYFVIWLERRLLKEPEVASALIFEITESGLQKNISASKRFIDMARRTGARITVEHFGVDLSSFKFFKELKPDFIKMDSTYTRDIDEDKNNQYFLSLMIDLAHRLNIKVLAESVENEKEQATLHQLFIDGFQGFYIGKPLPMLPQDAD